MSGNGLPFLPGLSIDNKLGKSNFGKPQGLTFSNRVNQVDLAKPGIGGSTAASPRGGTPGWLAYNRQVLCFTAYTIDEYNTEARIRNVKILYYLEDNTMQVNEKPQENSGIVQGTMMRRQRMNKPAPADDQFYGPLEIAGQNEENEIVILSRVFKLTGCDESTRNFLAEAGCPVNFPVAEAPDDAYFTSRTLRQQTLETLARHEKKTQTRDFLTFDKKVLRFYAAYDDTETGPLDRRFFELRYFLVDGSIEIYEHHPRNDGRDISRYGFAKRQRLPKSIDSILQPLGVTQRQNVLNAIGEGIYDRSARTLNEALEPDDPHAFYSDADLMIGSHISVFGRAFLIYDCDEYTKAHYKEKFGVEEITPAVLVPNAPVHTERYIPPPTGYGTEEDSMVSVRRLVLLPPKKPAARFIPRDVVGPETFVLRFQAKFANPGPTDGEREFVVSYFLVDDSLSVYEKKQNNSGIIPGKFAERDTTSGYTALDLFLGNTITIRKFKFLLMEADDYALKFMEEHDFPYSQPDYIIGRIKQLDQEELAFQFDDADRQGEGVLPYAKFAAALRAASKGELNDHEMRTVARAVGTSKDNQVSYVSLLPAGALEAKQADEDVSRRPSSALQGDLPDF